MRAAVSGGGAVVTLPGRQQYAIRVDGDKYELIGAVLLPGDRYPIYVTLGDDGQQWDTSDDVSDIIDALMGANQ